MTEASFQTVQSACKMWYTLFALEFPSEFWMISSKGFNNPV